MCWCANGFSYPPGGQAEGTPGNPITLSYQMQECLQVSRLWLNRLSKKSNDGLQRPMWISSGTKIKKENSCSFCCPSSPLRSHWIAWLVKTCYSCQHSHSPCTLALCILLLTWCETGKKSWQEVMLYESGCDSSLYDRRTNLEGGPPWIRIGFSYARPR